jgi:hypothetical protein
MKPNSELARSVAGGGRSQASSEAFLDPFVPNIVAPRSTKSLHLSGKCMEARGEKFAHGGRPDPRDKARPVVRPKEMFDPDLRMETLKVKARNFH